MPQHPDLPACQVCTVRFTPDRDACSFNASTGWYCPVCTRARGLATAAAVDRMARRAHVAGLRRRRPVQPAIEIVQAGVDRTHQTDHCDHCKKYLEGEEIFQTCDASRYLTLCQVCYRAAGNSVR